MTNVIVRLTTQHTVRGQALQSGLLLVPARSLSPVPGSTPMLGAPPSRRAAVAAPERGGEGVLVAVADAEHVSRLQAAGTPDGYVRWRMAMLRGIRTGADAYLSSGVADVLGRPATGFTDWAAREAAPAVNSSR